MPTAQWTRADLDPGIVVYRSWGGQPLVSEIEVNRNPLGPFQDGAWSLLANH